MRKLSIVLLIALVTISSVFAGDYEPPEDSQLFAWWISISWAEKLDTLRFVDIVEHTEPEIVFPRYAATLDKDGTLFIFPAEDKNFTIKIYTLEYEGEMPVYTIENFYQEESHILEGLIIGTGAFLAGFILGSILSK